MNLVFPLTPTANGSLAVADTPEKDAKTRALMVSYISQGERRILPNYGRPVHLFQPAFGQGIQAAELADALNQWATESGDIIYTVVPDARGGDHHPVLAVTWDSLTAQTQGGFYVEQS